MSYNLKNCSSYIAYNKITHPSLLVPFCTVLLVRDILMYIYYTLMTQYYIGKNIMIRKLLGYFLIIAFGKKLSLYSNIF